MAEEKMSEQTKRLLAQAQIYQQQIQGILLQKETLNQQLTEVKQALDGLEKTKEKEVYKLSGPLLIKSTVADARRELKEKEEVINLRVKTLEKSENTLKEKIEEFREKLSKSPEVAGGG